MEAKLQAWLESKGKTKSTHRMMAIRSPLIGTNQTSISQSSVKKLGCHRSAIAESSKLSGKGQRDAFVTAKNLFGGETPAVSHLLEPIQNLDLASPTKEDERYTFGEENHLVSEASLRARPTILLNSQQDSVLGSSEVPVFSTQCTEDSSFGEDMPAERRERRKWTPTDDVVLISSWLNTSKDPVVGNEQKSGAFWKRIATYFAASPKVAGGENQEPSHCKQRWQKINDLVCKFCGSYEAATREKASGQNENDVLKLTHEIFYNDHNKKFTLDHAWKELCNDHKWCELSTSKTDGSSKRKRCEDGAQSSSSHAFINLDDQSTNRPPGVKVSKGRGKRTTVEGKALSEFQSMWAIKEKDLAMKERLSKMGLLDSLIAKKELLSEYEEALKKKLITEMLSN